MNIFPKNFYGGLVVETLVVYVHKSEATRQQQEYTKKKPFKLTKTSFDKKMGIRKEVLWFLLLAKAGRAFWNCVAEADVLKNIF